MHFAGRFGMERLAWALRRLHCPVPRDALVLEVGSGGSPYARANVLLDAFEVTRQRHWAPLIADRPTVLGAVERLPFRDKAFDFVIASHVLEHSSDPEAFLLELQRVAHAGYIEVPDAFMERLNPYRDHRLEITVRDETLIIRKKAAWQTDPELAELYEANAKRFIAGEAIPRHPFAYHVRYYWHETILAKILNPEVDASWDAPAEIHVEPVKSLRARINTKVLSLARAMLSQRSRNRSLKLDSLLACPSCRGTSLDIGKTVIHCLECSTDYPIRNGLPVMFADSGKSTVV
ncbi:MAG: methyltransferase domain-containing protein [Thiobacillus sp.]